MKCSLARNPHERIYYTSVVIKCSLARNPHERTTIPVIVRSIIITTEVARCATPSCSQSQVVKDNGVRNSIDPPLSTGQYPHKRYLHGANILNKSAGVSLPGTERGTTNTEASLFSVHEPCRSCTRQFRLYTVLNVRGYSKYTLVLSNFFLGYVMNMKYFISKKFVFCVSRRRPSTF